MRIQFYVKILFMFIAVASASIVNFILFKSIQKTLELKINGVQTKAQLVDEDRFKLKFYVQDQAFYFEGQKPNEDLKNKDHSDESLEKVDQGTKTGEVNSEVEIIYNSKNPMSASTLAQYKFLNSFLVLMMIVFLVLGIAIFGFLKKIILSLKSS